jgi:hypothetical protein
MPCKEMTEPSLAFPLAQLKMVFIVIFSLPVSFCAVCSCIDDEVTDVFEMLEEVNYFTVISRFDS